MTNKDLTIKQLNEQKKEINDTIKKLNV